MSQKRNKTKKLGYLLMAFFALLVGYHLVEDYDANRYEAVVASHPVYSNEITNVTEYLEGNKRVVTEHHENARIPFITVYKYPFKDEVTGAAVPAPENVGGTDYYRVISTDADEDSGDEVCAIALNTSCNGYVDESVTGFNVCKAFHPTANEVTDVNGDVSVTYCNGNPQAAPCNSLSNTCLACPTCTNGVACNEAIGGLYREMYVTCAPSAATGVDLCNAGLDDDDGSGDGILDLTATETTFDGGSIIVEGCEIAIDGTHSFTDVTVRRNGRITQSPTGTGTFNTTDITVTGHTEIAIGSSIDVKGKGVAGQNHVDLDVSTTTPQAGTVNVHAGTLSTDPSEVYGDFFNPLYPGSGGSKSNGNGGGVLHLTLNTLELEGDINADSSNPSLCGGTTGSGGSIKINITGEMTGDGTITANALPCANATSDGSGGRVAIFYTTAGGINTLDPTEEYTVQALNESPNDGTPGTVYLEDTSRTGIDYNANEARLIVDEATFSHEKDLGTSGVNDDMNVVLPNNTTLYQLEIDDARVTVESTDDATVNIENLLDIRDGGELTYTDMTSLGLIKRLIIDADGATVQVSTGSFIDARGKGAIRNEQIDPDASTTNAVPGSNSSHGGLGNDTDSIDAVYGDFWDPQWPGSGVNSSANARGGGYIGITAETFTHNGTIRADGNNMSCNVPAPAGGSVKITTTGTFSGSGSINADAGDCTNGGSASGGGRVAFYYTTLGGINSTPPDQVFTITAQSPDPLAPTLNDSSPGTVYIEDSNAVTLGTYATGEGRLIIANPAGETGNKIGVPLLGTVNLYELSIDQARVTAETLVIEDSLTLTDSAVLRHEAMTSLGLIRRLNINSPNADVSIDATSLIDARGLGARRNEKIDPASSTTNAVAGANTSHAGLGYNTSDISNIYGDYWDPIWPGGGSPSANSSLTGGGVVIMNVDTLTHNGEIRADGASGSCNFPASAGGSIKITTGGAYSGSGTIQTNAGRCTNGGATSASGGRIAFYYTTAGSINATSPEDQFTIQSQSEQASSTSDDGSAGTIYIEDAFAVSQGTYLTQQGRLLIANPGALPDNPVGVALLGTLTLHELIIDQAIVTANELVVENLIDLDNGAILKHEPMVSLGPIESLEINSPNATLSIDATSQITARALGAIGAQSIDPQTSTTNAVGVTNRGHGGVFGTTYTRSYGDFRNPIWPGSGGSFSTRVGGGLVIINIENLDLDGTIGANAGNGGGCGGNYGSGGSIKVTATGELTGSGTLEAEGSRCTNSGTQTNGGGRIGFFYDSDPTGSVTNNSPETIYTFDTTFEIAATNPTGPGTVYIEDDNATNGDPDGQGDLIIDGESQTSVYSTPLFNDETPTSLTLTNVTVINDADLILTSPCTGSLTITGTIDLTNGGTITDNTAGACALSTTALNITPAIMDGAVSGVSYSDSVESVGGYAPKTYQCLDGLGGSVVTCDNANANLPNGLTMSSGGVVSGTPSATGTFNFVVRVTDSDPGGAQTDEETMQITVGNPPNTPTLVSPADASTTSSLTPELEANYSDNDAGDTGTTEFRVSTGSGTDCVNNINVVDAGTSAESTTNNEDVTYTVSVNLTDLTTYNWCARNNDGVSTSNGGAFTSLGSFTVDTSFSPGGSIQKQQQAIEQNNPDPDPDTDPGTDETDPGDETPADDDPGADAPEEETPADDPDGDPVDPEEPDSELPNITDPADPTEDPGTLPDPSDDLPEQEQDEAPGDGEAPPPLPPPTQPEIDNVDDIFEVIIDTEAEEATPPGSRVDDPSPSETGVETNAQSDGRSFTIEVEDQVLDEDLTITGMASTDDDRIEFTGNTSEPGSTITLFFNNNVTVVVTSDEDGFWQTFVSAEQLGLTPGQSATVQIEAIAAKDDLRSSKVDIGRIALNYSDEREAIAEFQSIVEESELVTNIQALTKQIDTILEEQQEIIQQTLVTAAPLIVISSAPLWGYLPYLPALIYHLIAYILGLLGKRKQEESLFGEVYDSITKEPLSLAVLRVYDQVTNKLISTKVTDKFGRYDLLLEPGKYRIEVKKPEFRFPSKIVTSGPDGSHTVVYNQEQGVEVMNGNFTLPDIPVDPIDAKREFSLANVLRKFWLMVQRVGHHLALPALFIGSFVSIITLLSSPESLMNWLVTGLYVLLLALQLRLRAKIQKAWGVVYDLATSAVLPLTTIQLIDPEYGKVVKSRLTDYEGRFAFMPEPGKYVVKADKPGYDQTEVVESSDKEHKPISGEVEIHKEGERIQGDIPMKHQ